MVVCQVADLCFGRRSDHGRILRDQFACRVVNEDSDFAGCGHDLLDPFAVAIIDVFADGCNRIAATVNGFDFNLFVLGVVGERGLPITYPVKF